MKETFNRVVIGMDPHKRSVTIEVMTADETVLSVALVGTRMSGLRPVVTDEQ